MSGTPRVPQNAGALFPMRNSFARVGDKASIQMVELFESLVFDTLAVSHTHLHHSSTYLHLYRQITWLKVDAAVSDVVVAIAVGAGVVPVEGERRTRRRSGERGFLSLPPHKY